MAIQPTVDPGTEIYALGKLGLEMAAAFGTGTVASNTSDPELILLGRQLQTNSATLLQDVADRYEIDLSTELPEPETGIVTVVGKAWSWLTRQGGKLLAKAQKHKGLFVTTALVFGGLPIVNDVLNGSERTRRLAIEKQHELAAQALDSLPPEQRAKALKRAMGQLSATAAPGTNWLMIAGIGLGGLLAYKLIKP